MTVWRSTPVSSSTTTAPTRPCFGSSPNSMWRRRTPTCRCRCATTAPASSTRAAWACAGCFPGGPTSPTPAYLRMLVEVPRFHRAARRLEPTPTTHPRRVPGPAGFSAYFRRHFMAPLVSAVWSCDPEIALEYPARYLFTFLDHHGMLGVKGSPTWRTVTGGSREYVAPGRRRAGRGPHRHQGHLGARDRHRCRRSPTATARPRRTTPSWSPPTRAGAEDARRADPAQREVLGAIPYSANHTLLHTDTIAAAGRAAAPGRRGTTVPVCAARPRAGDLRHDAAAATARPTPTTW